MTCSSHPACLFVLNNLLCFCFLEYLFLCDAVCVSDLSDFIHTGFGKHQFIHYPGLTGVESCRKDHRPKDLTFNKFWHNYKTTQAALMIPFAVLSLRSCLHLPMNRTSLLPVIRSCLNKQLISTPTLGAFASSVIVHSSRLEYTCTDSASSAMGQRAKCGSLRDLFASHCIPKHGLSILIVMLW